MCIITKSNDMTSSPMFADASPSMASNRIRLTTRAAFCSHNTRQATPSLRSGELVGNSRPHHSILTIQLGTRFRNNNCKRNSNGCHPVLSFPVSSSASASALGLTDKKSTPDETIDVNGDFTIGKMSHEKHNDVNNDLVEDSVSTSTETDLAPTSSNKLDTIDTTTTNTVARKQERTFFAKIAVLFSVVVLAVLKISPSGSWRYYLAGGICASTSHAITTPIDVVKVSYIVLFYL